VFRCAFSIVPPPEGPPRMSQKASPAGITMPPQVSLGDGGRAEREC